MPTFLLVRHDVRRRQLLLVARNYERPCGKRLAIAAMSPRPKGTSAARPISVLPDNSV
jgi:hypothetical protein